MMQTDPGPSTLTPQQALDRKMDALADMIGNVHELVERRTPSDEAVRVAVRDGIVAAASDREVWATAIGTLREQAKSEAGGWLFGGIKSFFTRVAWILVIGLGIYLVGGWSALVAFLKHGGSAP